MIDQHGPVPDPVGTKATAEQILEFRLYMEGEFDRINTRIDHIIGRHDITWDHPTCPSCEVRRAG